MAWGDYKYQTRWEARYGRKVAERLVASLDEQEAGKRCVDNYRVCRVGDAQEEAAYQAKVDRGCCAFHDWTVKVDGVEYRIGFNWDH